MELKNDGLPKKLSVATVCKVLFLMFTLMMLAACNDNTDDDKAMDNDVRDTEQNGLDNHADDPQINEGTVTDPSQESTVNPDGTDRTNPVEEGAEDIVDDTDHMIEDAIDEDDKNKDNKNKDNK